VALLGGIIAYAAGLFDKAPPPPPVVIAAPAPTPAPAVAPDVSIATPGAPVAAAPGTVAAVAPAAVPVGGQVTLTPTEDVWVKIYDAQRTTVKSGIIKAGEVYVVPADPPGLKLWTGKAGVLGIAVGGKALPPIGGPAQTVKDVSLAPADLVARSAAAAPAVAAAATTTAPR
jgi:hypothetical protein